MRNSPFFELLKSKMLKNILIFFQNFTFSDNCFLFCVFFYWKMRANGKQSILPDMQLNLLHNNACFKHLGQKRWEQIHFPCGTMPHVTSLSLIAFEPLRHLFHQSSFNIIQSHSISYIVLVRIIIPPELRIVKHEQHSQDT